MNAVIVGRLIYSAAAASGLLVAAWMLRRRQIGLGLAAETRLKIGLAGLAGATLMAKAPFVFGWVDNPAPNWVAAWWGDGKTVLWGLVGGYIGVVLAKGALGVQTRTGDSFVVPVAIAIAVGRIGCLAAGCCGGREFGNPWVFDALAGVSMTIQSHPVPIYEMVFHVGFAVVAMTAGGEEVARWLRNRWMPAYVCGYAVFRFWTEYLRREPVWWGGLTFYQCSALVIALAFFAVLLLPQNNPVRPGSL